MLELYLAEEAIILEQRFVRFFERDLVAKKSICSRRADLADRDSAKQTFQKKLRQSAD